MDAMVEEKTMKINLNEKVKVRLTELGVDIYRRSIYRSRIRLSIADDGSVMIQWWELMTLYGNYIGWGKPLPFHMVVEYEPQLEEDETDA